MKVAVVSNQSGQVGKSVVSLLLGLTFSVTQGRKAVILSTGDATSMYNQCSIDKSNDSLRNANIFGALMRNEALSDSQILDYADRIGQTETFVFNLFDTSIEEEKLHDLFMNTLSRLRTDLVIVEVAGDLKSDLNCEAMEACGAIFYVFKPNLDSIAKLQDYLNNGNRSWVSRTIFICQEYCPETISESRFTKGVGIAKKTFIYLPYNVAVVKACYDGMLESLIPSIIKGEPDTIDMRQKLLEMMQVLFDSTRVKYIKDFSKWPSL